MRVRSSIDRQICGGEEMKCLRLSAVRWNSSNTNAPSTPLSPTATFTCQTCKKEFKKADALRRHKHTHASHKPVLVCPRSDCQAYFSTTFNLQHHIRKVHLDLLKYKCSFPDCPRMFAMRVSETPKSTVSLREAARLGCLLLL